MAQARNKIKIDKASSTFKVGVESQLKNVKQWAVVSESKYSREYTDLQGAMRDDMSPFNKRDYNGSYIEHDDKRILIQKEPIYCAFLQEKLISYLGDRILE